VSYTLEVLGVSYSKNGEMLLEMMEYFLPSRVQSKCDQHMKLYLKRILKDHWWFHDC